MTISISQLQEARRALDAPLFADVAGDAVVVVFRILSAQDAEMEETPEAVTAARAASPRGFGLRVTYGAGRIDRRKRTQATGSADPARDEYGGGWAHLTLRPRRPKPNRCGSPRNIGRRASRPHRSALARDSRWRREVRFRHPRL